MLVRAVSYSDDRLKMPPSGKLSDAEITALTEWVREGAHWPTDSGAPIPGNKAFQISETQRNFWSFRDLEVSAPPSVRDAPWAQSPIDGFVLAKLEEKGMRPNIPADRRTLIRRVSYDLIGLPPTPEQVDTFLADDSPDALAKVVDQLLASERFGERWGRHWLDVARYGDDDANRRNGYPNAWRYRDWVIDAYNRDMPFDEFVVAQIAQDLTDPDSEAESRAGLGFLALGPWPYDIADPAIQRANERDALIDGVTRAFLGLTVACARCHDHKYDPISQKDYYALAGVFASSIYHDYPIVDEQTVEAYESRRKAIAEKRGELTRYQQALTDQLVEALSRRTADYLLASWRALGPQQADPAALASERGLDAPTLERWIDYLRLGAERLHPYLKDWDTLLASGAPFEQAKPVIDAFVAKIADVKREHEQVEAENAKVLAQIPKRVSEKIGPNGYTGFDTPEYGFATVAMERDRFILWQEVFGPTPPFWKADLQRRGVFVFEKDDLDQFLQGVWKDHVDALQAELKQLEDSAPEPYDFVMGLRDRVEPRDLPVDLRGNPLNTGEVVPRRFVEVLSNGQVQPFTDGSGRLQLARAIVEHPLTARVAANRIWQRLIGEGIVRTPDNFGQTGNRPTHPELLEYLAGRLRDVGWSQKALIREIVLSSTYQMSSDSLEYSASDPENHWLWRANPERLDIEAFRDGVLCVSGALDPKTGGPPFDWDAGSHRRTVYGKVSRYRLAETLALFDFPDPNHPAGKRNVTNVPLQRLFVLNSDFMIEQGRRFAERLRDEAGDSEEARLQRAYRLLFGREATPEETRVASEFLNGDGNGWPQLAQILLGANEFTYID